MANAKACASREAAVALRRKLVEEDRTRKRKYGELALHISSTMAGTYHVSSDTGCRVKRKKNKRDCLKVADIFLCCVESAVTSRQFYTLFVHTTVKVCIEWKSF